MALFRLAIISTALCLSACSSTPSSRTDDLFINNQSLCPLSLKQGQVLTVSLSSNPSTGYRWMIDEAVGNHLKLLGNEVFSATQAHALVGSDGLSTWRFSAQSQGQGYLSMRYQRPWETEPAEHFECSINIQ